MQYFTSDGIIFERVKLDSLDIDSPTLSPIQVVVGKYLSDKEGKVVTTNNCNHH